MTLTTWQKQYVWIAFITHSHTTYFLMAFKCSNYYIICNFGYQCKACWELKIHWPVSVNVTKNIQVHPKKKCPHRMWCFNLIGSLDRALPLWGVKRENRRGTPVVRPAYISAWSFRQQTIPQPHKSITPAPDRLKSTTLAYLLISFCYKQLMGCTCRWTAHKATDDGIRIA